MSFWQSLLSGVQRGMLMMSPRTTYIGAGEMGALMDPAQITAGQMWDSQPHFRTVVTFIARNIAQLGLHTFRRKGDGDRERDRDSALAMALDDADGNMTSFEMIFALVGDLLLYDRAYWLVVKDLSMPSGWSIRRLPPTWVEPRMTNLWEVKDYRVSMHVDGRPTIVKPKNMLAFPGYNPGSMYGSSPTVDALRETLQEQVEAARYRKQIWRRGGRVSSVLERPVTAPRWSDAARESFREDWYAKFTGKGSHSGGTPILEDGMVLKRIDFNAQEQQFVEAAKLSLQTVAAAFHINPTMIGQNEGATYSNVREFRKMLYGDSLGPLVAQIESRVNRFLVPMIMGQGSRRTYFTEFNIEEKLQGNFEEQAQALSASVGLPYMTRNEARAMRNLPALPGGDELGVPLNYLLGGQIPSQAGSQNRRSAPPLQVASRITAIKSAPPDPHVRLLQDMLSEFFQRQGQVIKSRLHQKDDDTPWWDYERWDQELSDDLYRLAVSISEEVASSTLKDIGFSPDEYDLDRTLAFLRSVSDRIAQQINLTTYGDLESALQEDDPAEAVAHVFDVAETSRAETSAITASTAVAGFATVEAAKQTASGKAKKQWVVNSSNPRAAHAALNGEVVDLHDNFSNGMPWPGAIEGTVDQVAGCQCSLRVFTE